MLVSIVLPCYNAEAFLDRSLGALFAQTHRPLELIAVDDGSTDGTLRLLEDAVARAPFPMTVLKQANAGACAARNRGLKLAQGEYVQFMDADDALLPEKVAVHVQAALMAGSPEIVVGASRTYGADGALKWTDAQEPVDRDPWLDLARHRLGGTPNNLWKRTALLEAGGWDEHMRSSQEYDLLFRLLQRGARVTHVSAMLTEVHLQGTGSISTQRLDLTWKRFIELRVRIIEHLRTEQPALDLSPYWQLLFDSVRTLYAYDPDEAIKLHARLLPSGFVPSVSPATGRGYLVLHRVLGFAWANRVRRWFARRS